MFDVNQDQYLFVTKVARQLVCLLQAESVHLLSDCLYSLIELLKLNRDQILK